MKYEFGPCRIDLSGDGAGSWDAIASYGEGSAGGETACVMLRGIDARQASELTAGASIALETAEGDCPCRHPGQDMLTEWRHLPVSLRISEDRDVLELRYEDADGGWTHIELNMMGYCPLCGRGLTEEAGTC